jgi:4-hydroxy-tetrahydrodipicolinate reductase
MPVRVVHFGLGPIGTSIVRLVAERPAFRIVGAIDVDPGKVGRDLGDIAGLGRRLKVAVSGDAREALRAARPDVVIHCTGSSLKAVLPQLQVILRHKARVVSTTEELAYPFHSNARAARQVDTWARARKVAVLGTGVNPGFAMDALPIMLSAVCERVERVSVQRLQDARIRRLPFQQKIGAGLTAAEFQAKVATGSVRHVGMTESIAMIAAALGWKLDRITDDVRAKIADQPVASEFLRVEAGRVSGIIQDGAGYRKGEPLIRLHLEAYLGAPETYDAVDIDGKPPLSMKLAGGIHGDIATASIVVNSIPKVLSAPPGLHTMRDLPLPSFFPGLAGR